MMREIERERAEENDDDDEDEDTSDLTNTKAPNSDRNAREIVRQMVGKNTIARFMRLRPFTTAFSS